jgi:hypothetical protein
MPALPAASLGKSSFSPCPDYLKLGILTVYVLRSSAYLADRVDPSRSKGQVRGSAVAMSLVVTPLESSLMRSGLKWGSLKRGAI